MRRIMQWNIATLGRYIWVVATKKDSLWLKWINAFTSGMMTGGLMFPLKIVAVTGGKYVKLKKG